ncbi:MAG: hypothetical protein NVS2B4_15320 [Ramlibacter sp.]
MTDFDSWRNARHEADLLLHRLDTEPIEQVIGPVHGYYFACYTVRDGSDYYGYAKLCPERPTDVWHTPGATAKLACGPHPHPQRALVGVVSVARRKLERRRHDLQWWG